MFVSFFPRPKLFFLSAIVWTALPRNVIVGGGIFAYPTPLDVLKVAIFATTDEADWRSFSALPVIAFVFKPLRWFEILKTGEPPTVWWIAGNGIAREPSRKNRYLYCR